ncbi:TonB-dependent receptor domain-containing protein [Moraxella catarrhalis]|uniref:TonB-dependent receptor domain-containing protein n=1 Tax=Moraxella catarrhalis TaxID=480 RepID=UPI000EA9ACA8|nr:TonB-dependent receptor [Moraxella catarrhalis]MPW68835.1 hypothetical protein [Moraxella catarrhalis]MPX37936.1 hypothetical protein [Moraxella catarrhalis]MPX70042.1 hypothetical protein [Moraxella catarrhalis]RKM21517.1 hypothetical protein D6D88_04060 [Moraxella catarrhalis]RKM22281.1 hypothetical protein D6D76_02205 [Moraxella catarrhalis]
MDKNGNPFTVAAGENGKAVLHANGKVYSDFDSKRVDQYWFDCDVFDCDSPVDAYEANYGRFVRTTKVNLDRRKTDPNTNKTYATTSQYSHKILMPFPSSQGYLENLYSDRDLNTNTKQMNLDFKKWLDKGSVSHHMTYGASYETTEKSMVNKSGCNAWSSTWWSDKTLGWDFSEKLRTCDNSSTFNGLLCPRHTTFSFLIPVKTKDGSVYLNDSVLIGDRVRLGLGYRYNRIKYQPNYIAGQTAKIPDDLVKGLFIPLPSNDVGEEPKWWSSKYSGRNDPKFRTDLADYHAKKEAYETKLAQNPAENIAYIGQPKTHSQHSYSISPAFDVTKNINLQVKYSKGFYTDFIDFVFRGLEDIERKSSRKWPVYQSMNWQNAKAEGIEINSVLKLGELVPAIDGTQVSYKMTRQKGRADGNIPMNAIQPDTSVFGIGYDAKNEKFGGNLYITRVSAKKAEDTYNLFWKEEQAKDSTLRWRSGGYTTVDLTGYYKPTKNLTLQLGAYNLTNKKYMTWDSARSIRPFGTSNMIDKKNDKGINRFLAPGRNFKVSLEYVF